MIYLAVAGAVAFVLLSGDPDPQPATAKKKRSAGGATEDLGKYLPGNSPVDSGTEKTAEQFFKAGFREYISGNYLRAKSQFETVLQMAPGHPLATLYLQNCENAIKLEVKFHLEQGMTGSEAGKLKEAKAHFEAVMRILYRDQSNPAFGEARDALERLVTTGSAKVDPSTAPKGEGG